MFLSSNLFLFSSLCLFSSLLLSSSLLYRYAEHFRRDLLAAYNKAKKNDAYYDKVLTAAKGGTDLEYGEAVDIKTNKLTESSDCITQMIESSKMIKTIVSKSAGV